MAGVNFKSMKKQTREQLVTFVGILIVYASVQLLIAGGGMSSLMEGLLVPMCTYSIVAVSLNLCVGYLGDLSLGHAGFMCVGAFCGALTTKLLQDAIANEILLFICALLAGVAAAALFGFLIGIPVLRLRGDYLAIVTLAFGEIIKNVVNVLYVARDTDGLYVSLSDGAAISLSEEGEWLVNGARGMMKIGRAHV